MFNPKHSKGYRRYLRNHSTKAEIHLWNSLKNKQLNGFKFRRQHGIGKYIVDFYCPELELVIEVDGPSHFTEKGIRHDLKRSNFLTSKGFTIVRFTNEEVLHNRDGVLLHLASVCEELSGDE